MKTLIIAIIMSLSFPFGHFSFGNVLTIQEESHKSSKSHKIRKYEDLAEKEEFQQNYKLQAGAKIDVTDISGVLEVETTEGDTAEVYIVRSAKERKHLESEKIVVENTPDSLRIYTKSNFSFNGHRELRQRVILKLPKQVNLSLSDISGFAEVGRINGSLKVKDISGSIYIEEANSFTELQDISGSVRLGAVSDCERISDISGNVEINIEKLSSNGLKIYDISGNVNLKFASDVNANLKVRDVSGNVSVNTLNLTITRKYDRSEFDGQIGSGGAALNISDISGSVKLTTQSLN